MLWETTFLLAVALVGRILSDQSQEVYKKDDSTFIRGAAPKFRDASDFTTPSSDAHYVSIDGLPANQHGFMLVNPQYQAQQLSKKVTASERKEIREQDEFVKSILEANKAAIDPQKSTSNIFRPSQPIPSSTFRNGAFQSDSSDDTIFGTLDLLGTGAPLDSTADSGETTTHSVFNFNFPRENKRTSSPEEFLRNDKDLMRGRAPKPVQRTDFNHFQSDVSPVSSGGRKHSFAFRDRETSPALRPDAGSAAQDSRRFGLTGFASERPAFTRISTNENRKPVGVSQFDRNPSSRLNPTTPSSRPSVAEPSLLSGFPFNSEDTFGTRQQPGFFDIQSPVVPQTRFEFRGQEGDDEESKFISQVNHNTASFVSKNSQVNGFDGSVPVSFETIQAARDKLSGKIFTEDFPAPTQPIENKRRIESGQRLRTPFQNSGASQETQALPPAPINRFAQSSKLPIANSNEFEEKSMDQELEARKMAEGAKYSFASAVTDSVNDNSQIRQEVRDGLKLKGMYSYSDGYFKRTVYYEADEGGYRVVKEENEPIGTGPQFNPNGEVLVNYQQDGSNLQYKIRGDQLRKAPKKVPKVQNSPRFDDYNDQLELPN